jgi:hypothetical protein
MFRIEFSDDLNKIQKGLNDQWMDKIIKKMPFPIAYPLHRAREEGYPWHQVLKDLLNAVLHYAALLAVSEYMASGEEPDFDINEVIQERIGRGISEGHWLSFIRICVKKRENKTKIPILSEVFFALEKENKVLLEDDEHDMKPRREGLLSTWIALRNKFIHGPELNDQAKKERIDKILSLVKSIIHFLEPLSEYHYCHRIKGKRFEGLFDLTGVEDFRELEFDGALGKSEGLLIIDQKKKEYLPLFPLYISYKGKKGIIKEDSEVYLINTIEKQKPSQYMSPPGNFVSPKEMKEHVIGYFNKKRIYEKRQDIELAEVYTKGLEKNRWIVEELVAQGLYIPDKYVEREEFARDIEAFLSSGKKAVIISGESGSGKTSSLIHWAGNMLQNNEMAFMIRCEGLPAAALNPDKLERTLSEELGYAGNFEEIIDWFDKKNKRFCLILEGMNEFVGPGKDLWRFFESINTLLSRYRDKKSLKILISTTSETVPHFLNEQKVLPESMAEEKELYFHGKEGDIYGFRKFSQEELQTVAKNYDVPYWAVEEVRKNKKIDLLNPRQFHIFAELFKTWTEEDIAEFKEKETHQKIVNEMLKYSGYKLADKHVSRVLKKDKKLLTILEEMARFMHKQKDLSPTWARYEEKNPKLALMLKENNWENLMQLKELQLIKEERISGSESIGDWKLSFRHDKVYDILTKRNKKKSIILREKAIVFLFLVYSIFISFITIKFNIEQTLSKKFIETTIEKRSKDLGMVSTQSLKIYKELLKYDAVQRKKLVNHMVISTLILVFMVYLFLFAISIIPDILLYFEKLFRKKRDYRIEYLIEDFKIARLKRGNKYFIFVIIFLFIGLILERTIIKNIPERKTIIFLIILLFVLSIPFLYKLFRDGNEFIRKSQSKTIFKYCTDKFALLRSLFFYFFGSFITGIFLISFYNFTGSIVPFKPLTPKIDYLNAENPAYSELLEKKWVSKDKIDKANEEIRKLEEKLFINQIKEIFLKNKINTIFFYMWLLISALLTIPIIHIFFLRRKLGTYFR